jgi:hypothetical protein
MRLSLLLVLAITVPGALRAQVRPDELRQFAPVCDSLHRPVMDSSQMIVTLEAGRKWKDIEYTDAQRNTIRFYADAIRQHFHPPESLGNLPIVGEVKDGKGSIVMSSALSGSIIVVTRANGGVRDVMWQATPLSIRLANAISAAIQDARLAGDLDGIPRLNDSSADDTVVVDLWALKDSSRAEFPLMRIGIVSYVVDITATARNDRAPRFPPSASRAGVGTKAEVQFAIGADGKAVQSTIQVTRTDWRDFVAPLRDGIQAAGFIPARSGRCSVPTIDRQPFNFEINR